jgi:hypothetical protein
MTEKKIIHFLYVVLLIYNLIWLFCMKVIGETFFMKKGAEGARYEAYLNSQAKGLLPDRTLESFYYLKTPKV